MKRRLRKKLRRREFIQWGFLLHVDYADTDDREQLFDWIYSVMDLCGERGWMAGGAGTWLVCEEGYYTLTEETIGAFCSDLLCLSGVTGYRRSKMVDANDRRFEDAMNWPPLVYRS